jgi:helicase-like protein/SNF2 domain-containing protein
MRSPTSSGSTPPTAVRWTAPRILAEELRAPAEPLALLLRPTTQAPPALVAARAARALLDLPAVPVAPPPPWLAPHQVPAFERLTALVRRRGGALLADAVGLGKSYVALAVAAALEEPFALVVPAVLVPQWRGLLERLHLDAPIVTHERLSVGPVRLADRPPVRLFLVDEAHRFRNPDTRRYRALAALTVGARVLLVTATPVHNRIGDLFDLFRLFLRDHALAGLGVPSLRRAARGELSAPTIAAVAARFVVARSREQVRRAGYPSPAAGPVLTFPARRPPRVLRPSPLSDDALSAVVSRVARLGAGAAAAPLFRLMLLRRLASSLPAFRAGLERYSAFLDLARAAAADGRALSRADFQRLFPRLEIAEEDVQLVLFPLLLAPGSLPPVTGDEALVAELRSLTRAAPDPDPKCEALVGLLEERPARTIVFTDSRITARHLQGRLGRRYRLAALWGGDSGWLGTTRATRAEVLRAFAPLAQGAPAPPPALHTDVLVATDLLSEGLNLQDAARVVHYDLPWSPARFAQRVGRIDRLGSAHGSIESVSFAPPEALERALRLESRLAVKARAATLAGAAGIETPEREPSAVAALDWADRLHRLAWGEIAAAGLVAAVAGGEPCTVLVVRLGAAVEAIVVDSTGARADPAGATAALENALPGVTVPLDPAELESAIGLAAPIVRARLAAIADARWRAGDRDRLSRRLIPWVLSEARRAARRRDPRRLAGLDALVARLAAGMTAGEEELLDRLLERRAPLTIAALLEWHAGLPPLAEPEAAPTVELVAALQVRAG